MLVALHIFYLAVNQRRWSSLGDGRESCLPLNQGTPEKGAEADENESLPPPTHRTWLPGGEIYPLVPINNPKQPRLLLTCTS